LEGSTIEAFYKNEQLRRTIEYASDDHVFGWWPKNRGNLKIQSNWKRMP